MGLLSASCLAALFCLLSSVDGVLYDVRPPQCASVQVKLEKGTKK